MNYITVLVSRPHGRFDTTVGEESAEDQVLDAVLSEKEVKIGRVETAKARFTFDDQITILGSH